MRRRRLRLGTLVLAAALLAAPSGNRPQPRAAGSRTPPTLDALLSERVRVPLAALAERVALAPGEDFRIAEIGRDAGTSHHVVAIRTAEVPHRHDHHDLFVVLLRGHGAMRIGDATEPVGEQSLLYVPRGAVHAFANRSAETALAYVVYAPPFDGVDRVELPASEPAR